MAQGCAASCEPPASRTQSRLNRLAVDLVNVSACYAAAQQSRRLACSTRSTKPATTPRTPLRFAARPTRDFWTSPLNPAARQRPRPHGSIATADLFANLTRRYGKPDWGIDTVEIDGQPVRVRPTDGLVEPLVQADPLRPRHGRHAPGRPPRAGARGADRRARCRATTPPCCAARSRPSCRTTRSTSPTGPTPATCRCWKAASTSTTTSTTSATMLRADRPARRTWSAVCQPGPPVLAAAALMAEDGDPQPPGLA